MKFIHGEFMTHRRFSRNASSSRAVPTAKLLEEVRSNSLRAAPVWWGKNQAGMQAAEELSDEPVIKHPPEVSETTAFFSEREKAKMVWRQAAITAAMYADALLKVGAHKQLVNRLLEPFSHINVVCTATEYLNFFGLRLDKAAQPEMRTLAEAMWAAYNESTPRPCQPAANWHLPFFQPDDWHHLEAAQKTTDEFSKWMTDPGEFSDSYAKDLAIKVSVARCARVSYTSHETGKRSTVEEDLKLYDRLLGAQPLHASPAEHQATPDIPIPYDAAILPKGLVVRGGGPIWECRDQHGNFTGWRQYRKMLPGEDLAPLPEEYQK